MTVPHTDPISRKVRTAVYSAPGPSRVVDGDNAGAPGVLLHQFWRAL